MSYINDYRKTKQGLIYKIYSNQVGKSKRRGHVPPNYTLDELRMWALSKQVFLDLFDNWVASGYDKKLVPSFDRKDDDKPYMLSNLNIVTWDENNKRANSDRKNGINNKVSKSVNKLDSNKNIIETFYSAAEAGRAIGKNYSSISNCCNGKRKTAYGFNWEYA